MPERALLAKYRVTGTYTDCFVTSVPVRATLGDFVDAFYNTWLFRLERRILTLALGISSTDAQARLVADGALQEYAAWTVEGCAGDQLLMCDLRAHTRSWFMVAAEGATTRLYFGSAVVPQTDRMGRKRVSVTYRALLGFHKRYSRGLLGAARARLMRLR